MDYLPTNLFWIVGLALLTLVVALTMGLLGGNKLPVDGKTVLITGGSEGMGLSAAQQLAAKGANVIILSRNATKLKAALQSIQAAAKNPSSQRFHYISADISQANYASAVIEEATAWNNGQSPDIVWCVAGAAYPELFLDMEMSSMRYQMDVNYWGAAEMSHAILKVWLHPDAPVEKIPRHLILTSSVVALYTIPGYAPYAPSKWALRGLVETLSQEAMLYPQNVQVQLVYPGTILSPGYVVENTTKPAITAKIEEADPKQTPDQAAEAAIRGLENGHYTVTVSWLGELMRLGTIGGNFRNNWIIDTLGAWLVSLVWIFVQSDIHGKIRSYGKKHGHPSSYKKRQA